MKWRRWSHSLTPQTQKAKGSNDVNVVIDWPCSHKRLMGQMVWWCHSLTLQPQKANGSNDVNDVINWPCSHRRLMGEMVWWCHSLTLQPQKANRSNDVNDFIDWPCSHRRLMGEMAWILTFNDLRRLKPQMIWMAWNRTFNYLIVTGNRRVTQLAGMAADGWKLEKIIISGVSDIAKVFYSARVNGNVLNLMNVAVFNFVLLFFRYLSIY